MYPQLIYVALFLAGIACLPVLVKWVTQRNALGVNAIPGASKLISALAVGPNQRVVTVEVGPSHDRIWLVLGVTPEHVVCLHRCGPKESLAEGGSELTQAVVHSDSHV